jgi:hypothetical protein
MISQLQLEANRHNAQNSTGPKTAEGKDHSRQNARTHGITGKIAFADRHFIQELSDALNPQTVLERQYAESIAEDHWRIKRIRAVEAEIFAKGDPAEIFLEHAKELSLLTLYEQRINRNIQRNLAQLKALQTERKAEHDRQMEQAQLLSQLSIIKGLPYNPAQDGFVFSNAEINFQIDRNTRLKEARALDSQTNSTRLTRAA